MSKKLSVEQKKLIRSVVKSHQAGMGFFEDVGSFFSKIVHDPTVRSIASTVGPIVLEKFIIPMIEKKMGGGGVVLAGKGKTKKKAKGCGLKLAGSGKLVKGTPETKAHMALLRSMRKPKK